MSAAALVYMYLFAFLNRAAGSDLYGWRPFGLKLPGHPAVWIAPFVIVAALWLWSPLQALAWTADFLFWRLQPQGRLIDLKHGFDTANRAGITMTLPERFVAALSFGNVWLALFWRHLTIWPGLVLIWSLGGPLALVWLGPVIALTFTAAHWLARKIDPYDFHPLAELMHGATFGVLLCTAAF